MIGYAIMFFAGVVADAYGAIIFEHVYERWANNGPRLRKGE